MGVIYAEFEQHEEPEWKQQVRSDVRRYKMRWRVIRRALRRLGQAFAARVKRISIRRSKPSVAVCTGYDGSPRKLTTNSKMKLILATDPLPAPRLTAPVGRGE